MKSWNPNQPLDILVCGFPISRIDPRRPYGALRGNATRAFGLANNFALQGWKTGLVVERDCEAFPSPFVCDELRLVSRSNLFKATVAAQVLLLASTNLKTLRQLVPEVFTIEHPHKWVATCSAHNDCEDLSSLVKDVIGVSFNNELQVEVWRARGFTMPVHIVAYGVDENSYIDDAIVPSMRPTAIWIGDLRLPRTLEKIVRFAEVNPECEVKVVSGLIFDQRLPNGTEGSLTQPYVDYRAEVEVKNVATPFSADFKIDRSQFAEVVQLWCGRSIPANLQFLGPRPGQNAELLGKANLALGFSRRTEQKHDDSKILEYLRSGLPVLCDDGQPSYRFVQETGHGYVMPFTAGDEVLREGFQRCLALSSLQMRRAVAVQVRDRYGWPTVARQVREWILSDIKTTVKAADQTLQPEALPSIRELNQVKVSKEDKFDNKAEVLTSNVKPGILDSRNSIRLLYIPWIEGHTGALVKLLESAGGIEFVPLPLLDMIPNRKGTHRFEIMHLAETQPAEFFRLLGGIIHRQVESMNALFLTVDWCSALRETVKAFRDSSFPTVLVPHESVFAREDLYYRDPVTGTDVPQADMALVWGGLQEDIFLRRGMDPERLRIVGSPKLDFIRHYRSTINRNDFYTQWKLCSEIPVVLFATQPLDNQFDTPQALAAQNCAINDCFELCCRHGWQLVVRMPPARGCEILEPQLLAALQQSGIAAVDGDREGHHFAAPHDAMFHADAIISINSTMLLEASLMQRPALSLGYVETDQFWHRKGGLPLVKNRQELEAGLQRAMKERCALFTEGGWRWIRWAFSPGDFDGQSTRRIRNFIAERWHEPRSLMSVAKRLLPETRSAQNAVIFVWDNPSLVEFCLDLARTLSDMGLNPVFIIISDKECDSLAKAGYKHEYIQKDFFDLLPTMQTWVEEHRGKSFDDLDYININLFEDTRFERECLSRGYHTPLGWKSHEEIFVKSAVYLEILQHLLDKYNPSVCFVWNGLFYPPRALNSLCVNRNIPICFLERGLLPGLLVVDSRGINYSGSLGGSNWDVIQRETPELDKKLVESYIQKFCTDRVSVVKHGEILNRTEICRRLCISPERRIILIPNQIDLDSNIIFYSPLYPTNESVIKDVVEITEELPNAFICIKTHPENSGEPIERYLKILGSKGSIVSDINVHSLIDAADVVIVRNSTVGLESVLFGKSVITLGLSAYSNKGITYDVRNREDLVNILRNLWNEEYPGLPEPEKLHPFVGYLIHGYHYKLGGSEKEYNIQFLNKVIREARERARSDNCSNLNKVTEESSVEAISGMNRICQSAGPSNNFSSTTNGSCFEELIHNTHTPSYHFQASVQLEKEGRYDEAIEEIKLALADEPDNADFYYKYAQLFQAIEQYDQSLLQLKKVVFFNPCHADAHNDLGVLYFQKGDYEKAVEHFKKAVSLGNNWTIHRNLGEVLMQLNRYDEALPILENMLQHLPGDSEIKEMIKICRTVIVDNSPVTNNHDCGDETMEKVWVLTSIKNGSVLGVFKSHKDANTWTNDHRQSGEIKEYTLNDAGTGWKLESVNRHMVKSRTEAKSYLIRRASEIIQETQKPIWVVIDQSPFSEEVVAEIQNSHMNAKFFSVGQLLRQKISQETKPGGIICALADVRTTTSLATSLLQNDNLNSIPFEYTHQMVEEYRILMKHDWQEDFHMVSPLLKSDIDYFGIYEESLKIFERKCQIRDYLDLCQLIHSILSNRIPGDIAEFGSFKGHSGYLIARVLEAHQDYRPFYMFDTFDHFPDEQNSLDFFWTNTHIVNFEEVKSKLRSFSNVKLVKGDFTKTFDQTGIHQLALVYVDCDSYRATDYLINRIFDEVLSPGGVMIFEDYGHAALLGNRVAIHNNFDNRKGSFQFFSQFSGFYVVVKMQGLNSPDNKRGRPLTDDSIEHIHSEEVIKFSPQQSSVGSHLQASIELEKDGHIDDAIDEVKLALAEEPDNADVYYRYAQLLQTGEQYDESLMQLKKVVFFNPSHVNAHNDIGVLYYQKGLFDKAVEHLTKAASLDSNFTAHRNLGDALMQLGRYDEALPVLEKIVKHAPDDNDVLQKISTCRELSGQVKTEKLLSAKLKPTDLQTNATVTVNDVTAREVASIETVQQRQAHALGLCQQATVLIKKGEYSSGIKMLDDAIALVPTIQEANFARALCLYQLNRFDEAETALLTELVVTPHHSGAEAMLDELQKKKQVQTIFVKNDTCPKEPFESCEWLEYGLDFQATVIQSCCFAVVGGKHCPVLSRENYRGQLLDFEKMFRAKWAMRQIQRSGHTNRECIGCENLRKDNWSDEHIINRITLCHWRHCNSRCTYCYTEPQKAFNNAWKPYNILPVIQDMIAQGVLARNPSIDFGGGEPTILKEFEELVALLINHGASLHVNSNGIKFSPIIKESLSQNKIRVTVSVDSGTKEVFQKIKQVNVFERVWENLRRYAEADSAEPAQINTKFIIVPGVNDTESEINNWLDLTKRAGIREVIIELEREWYMANRNKIPEHILDLISLAQSLAVEKKINFVPQHYIGRILRERALVTA